MRQTKKDQLEKFKSAIADNKIREVFKKMQNVRPISEPFQKMEDRLNVDKTRKKIRGIK